jgi:hypothetical protein
MPLEQKIGHELGLLRRIAHNLATSPLPPGQVIEDHLRAAGLARARRSPDALIGILRPGIDAFSELSEKMFCKSPKMERGTAFTNYQDEFFSVLLSEYFGRSPTSIVDDDVIHVEKNLADWFSNRVSKRTNFVPCMISPWPSPRFSVGPVSFIFLEEVVTSEYYPRDRASTEMTVFDFDKLLTAMRTERAHWLAIVDVEDCDQQRALEVGVLAVDLAIVALQLAAPYMGTKNMSRLATRRGPGMKLTLSVSDGHYSTGWSNTEPGTAIGNGYLGQIVRETAPLVTAVGNCIRSFTTGSFRLPRLEKAWCDAAYWLHQGLAEPVDSIAVAKLETAIEVLFRAESTSGSQTRMMAALETFYGLKADDHIHSDSQITAKQFAKGFVQDRSRVLHGTWSTLNSRLSASRDALENLSITLVRASAVELDLYVQSTSATDDVKDFLAWVKARRQQQLNTQAQG